MRTDDPQIAQTLRDVHSQLGAVLKSDVAIDPLARPAQGSFRTFVSRSIAVLHVQGGAVAIHKAASRASEVHLLRLRRGSVQLSHAGGSTLLQAGQFVAFRGGQALEFRHEQSIELLGVYLPASAVERWLPDWSAAEFLTVADHQAEGRLSFDIARDLLSCGNSLQDAGAADLVAETVTRLVARSLAMRALLDHVAPEDVAEANRRKVRQFCRVNLGVPDLSIEMVARATGMSRASLHRLFRDQPCTLMRWVQQERLTACRRLIEAPGRPTRTLTEIALSQGFKSPAHFSAAFRECYGLTPRDYRATIAAAHARPSRQ